MPLTKEDSDRAVSILTDLLSGLEPDGCEEEETGEWAEHYAAIQPMLDLLQSPLFSALVDIRNLYQKTVEECQMRSPAAEVKLSEEPELEAQFCQRYGIPSSLQNGVGEREGGSPLTCVDEVMEDAVSQPVRATQEVVDLELGDFGSTLVERHHGLDHLVGMRSALKTTDGGVDDSSATQRVTSLPEDRTGSSTVPLVEEIKKKQKKKRGRWSFGNGGGRSPRGVKVGKSMSGEHGGITLAHLAHPVPSSREEGFPMSSFSQETNIERIRGSSESSLSSFSSESSQQPPLPFQGKPHSSKNKGASGDSMEGDASKGRTPAASGDSVEGDVSEGRTPRDILFFMRDKRSRTEIREALYGRNGRESRELTLKSLGGGRGLGVEISGLSSTGVFVSAMAAEGGPEGVQVGDQILTVNGQSTEDMASFEVNQLLKEAPTGAEVVLVLQYNPVGLAEYQRIQKK